MGYNNARAETLKMGLGAYGMDARTSRIGFALYFIEVVRSRVCK